MSTVSAPVRRVLAGFLFCLLAATCSTFAQGPTDNPIADPKAVVIEGNARFTVLTPQLIRMEWSEAGKFEDRSSLVFINRRMPVPAFHSTREEGWLVLRTVKLTLRYKEGGGPFTPETLTIAFDLNGKTIEWKPGIKDEGNLGGTIRTLDGVRGSIPLGEGLISRDGWVLVDDTERPLFDGSEWNWAVPRPSGKRQDWYFFGYGHDYRRALAEFTRVAGKIPLPPRFAFGTWWSRYWAYTDRELEELVNEFHTHAVPLDVLVIDMDWHPTFGVKWWENKKDPSGHTLGWTGYTWNKLYFPDPTQLLQEMHEQGLKVTLNMHPASGVQPWEEKYPEMARAMGIDPATKQYVRFDIANKKFAENYMKIIHYPLEKQGIDFFWLDWQQEPDSGVAGLNNTWWLNYVHFTDMERRGKRPIIYHRWGGLGNHRYEIGFSGDVISSWESLAFQPYFTATAANVGYGYWSHDIGGHIPGTVAPELYARWIQWGAFSPILRTHTTKNPQAERRIWAYPADYAAVMRDAFVLRYALIPYIYTSARNSYDTGISICHPLYYDYPEAQEAYSFKNEYLYGDSMLVAPVAGPVDDKSQLAKATIWLPPGDWVEWFTSARLKGPAKFERSFALDEIPIYVKAGAIIPMEPEMSHTGAKPVDPLILTIFPGDSSSTRVYEDEGDTLGYKQGAFAWTTVRHTRTAEERRIEILPAEASYPGMLTARGYEIRLPESWPPESVSYNGKAVTYSRDCAAPGWCYDGDMLTATISLPRVSVNDRVEVIVKTSAAEDSRPDLLEGARGRLNALRGAMRVLDTTWPQGWSPDSLLEAAQTGERIGWQPSTALGELEKLERNMPKVIHDISEMDVDPEVIIRALARLGQPVKIVPSQPQAEKP